MNIVPIPRRHWVPPGAREPYSVPIATWWRWWAWEQGSVQRAQERWIKEFGDGLCSSDGKAAPETSSERVQAHLSPAPAALPDVYEGNFGEARSPRQGNEVTYATGKTEGTVT